VALWPGSLPRAENVVLDVRVLTFAVSVSLAGGLLFGLFPAVRLRTWGQPDPRLTVGPRAAGRARLHDAFVVAQISLALLLLVAAGVLSRALLRLSSVETGLDADNVLIARMALDPATLEDAGRTRAAWDAALERARRAGNVEAAALVDTVPMRAGNNQLVFSPLPTLPPADEQALALATCVTPEYLRVMGPELVRGRFFEARDRIDSEPVVVIDEVLARQAFGERDAVGTSLWVPAMGPDPLRVIGVVRHVRHWGRATDDTAAVRAQLYYPFAQLPDALVRRWSELMSIAVRTSGEPTAALPALRATLQPAGAEQALYDVRTMADLSAATIAQQRFLLLLFATFAGLATVLACLGVYGVLMYVTGLRVREMGVRLALGASPAGLIAMVLRDSIRLSGIGVALGAVGAVAAARVLASSVPGVDPSGPWELAVMAVLLAGAALAAAFVPARRAARVDPVRALRVD
jgi:predicted permease